MINDHKWIIENNRNLEFVKPVILPVTSIKFPNFDKFNDNIKDYLKNYLFPKSKFIEKIMKHCHLCGSTLLNAILGIKDPNTDIDLICDYEYRIQTIKEMIFKEVDLKDPFDYKLLLYKKHRWKFILNGVTYDIFETNNIPETIKYFHLSCVRAVYKNELYFFPSFIRTMKSRICYNHKIINPKKNAVGIILKYFKKDFGFIISDTRFKKIVDVEDILKQNKIPYKIQKLAI